MEGTGSPNGDLLLGGAVGGLLAGVAMGLSMHFVVGIMTVVGALYTLDSVAAGWDFHLFHAVVFGLFFAAGMTARTAREREFGPAATTDLGLARGIVLWLVAAGVVMPLWMGAVGLSAPPVPNWAPMSGVGHVVYGLVLGTVFAGLDR